jgi:hypothetical protein
MTRERYNERQWSGDLPVSDQQRAIVPRHRVLHTDAKVTRRGKKDPKEFGIEAIVCAPNAFGCGYAALGDFRASLPPPSGDCRILIVMVE